MHPWNHRVCSLSFALPVALLLTLAGSGAAETSTLTLDSLSFISFEDQITSTIPAGGTIQFEFGAPRTDGTIPFQIAPDGVQLSSVTLTGLNSEIQYTLAAAAQGEMADTPSGRRISFAGTVSARDLSVPIDVSRNYSMQFSTETATARSIDGSTVVSRQGYRPPEGANYVQLVGATVAKSENEKGSAVYMVLSGTFDRLP